MKTPLILFLGLTVATCVIAYWADNLGKKLGKKRISLFGLRPRQTATLISMVSSWGIMLLTLGVLLVFFSDLRHALLDFDRIREQNQVMRRQRNALRAQAGHLKQEAEESRRHADEARRDYETALGELQGAEQKLTVEQKRLRVAQDAKSRAEAARAAAQANAAAARGQYARVQAQLVSTTHSYENVKTWLTQARAKLQGAQGQLHVVQAKLTHTQAYLAVVERNLKAANESYSTVQTRALLAIGELAKKRDELMVQVAERQKQVELLQQNVENLSALTGQLQRNIAFRGKRTLSIGDVLASHTLPARASADEVRTAVSQLFTEAEEFVRQPAINAQALRLPSLPGSQNVPLSEADISALLVSYLSTLEKPVSVRLVSALNHFEGDRQISAQFVTVPERTIFNHGDVIAEAEISGGQSDARIFSQLLSLVERAEKAAGERGVNPPRSPENPAFFAASTNERLFEALRRIQGLGGSAEVRLLAASDVSSIAPISVRFEVLKKTTS